MGVCIFTIVKNETLPQYMKHDELYCMIDERQGNPTKSQKKPGNSTLGI